MAVGPLLLAAKLAAPPTRPNRVRREHLFERLDAGLREGRALTLISAPAGFGKTTRMTEWLAARHTAVPCAWVSLDDDDNDPRRFLAYLAEAGDRLAARAGDITRSLLQTAGPLDAKVAMAALIHGLQGRDTPSVLVLDDYHVITASAIHQEVAYWLEHRPPQLQLAILTRADPLGLPLARLRGRGELTELRSADLRFSRSETAAFLEGSMGVALPADQIDVLGARTEGWVAGLQLAALSLRGQGAASACDFVAAFSGSHRYIVDYLTVEVLNRQTDALRDFLLKTSILEPLTGPLCDALLDEGPSASDRIPTSVARSGPSSSVLEELERSNLFITALDDERSRYRYHPLFAEVLQRRLLQLLPDQVEPLHCRAAEWYASHGLIQPAISHALAGGDIDRAIRLVETVGFEMVLRGEVAPVGNWVAALEPLSPGHPWLAILKGVLLTASGQSVAAETVLQAAEGFVHAAGPASDQAVMLGHIAACRGYLAYTQGDLTRAADLGQQALAQLPETYRAIRSVAAISLGLAWQQSGDQTGAAQMLAQAAHSAREAGNLQAQVVASSARGDVLVDQGHLREAAAVYREALHTATTRDGCRLPVAGRPLFGLIHLLYEWNDLAGASGCVHQYLDLHRLWDNAASLATGYVLLARLQQAHGNSAAARAALQQAQVLASGRAVPAERASWVAALQAGVWLAQGDVEACARWAQAQGLALEDEIPPIRQPEYVMLARVLLAQGEARAALTLLERLLETAERAGRKGCAVELAILRALALQACGRSTQAVHALAPALALAQSEGYVRVFLDQGEPMAILLRRAASHGVAPAYVAELLGAMASLPGAGSSPAQPLLEPLSDRELEVLRLLAEGKSNRAIAAKLVLAPGTVKKHVSNIYGKMNVENRAQCVARARDLRLL